MGTRGQAVSESVESFAERRAHPRVEVAIPVELDVEPGKEPTAGTVVNLSRGGLLVSVHHQMKVGEHCTARFPTSKGKYSALRSATVVRSQADESRCLVALQFHSSLPAAPGAESLFPAKFPGS